MHICYVDDSGRGKARTVTGLIIPAAHWNDLTHCWLEGRKRLTATWGVREHVELHGNELARGRGAYCVSDEHERIFKNRALRLRAYDRMLGAVAGCGALSVTTVCCPTAHMPTAYARFVEHLERWATEVDTQVLVVLDGYAGPAEGDATAADPAAALEAAYRNARPYRQVHRRLDLRTRRVIEDPIVRDSKSSHLVQAADLVAYAAAQWLWINTDLWPKGGPRHGRPITEIAEAYEGLSGLWFLAKILVSPGQRRASRNTKKPSDDRGLFEGEIPW